MDLPTIKRRAAERLSALELLLQEPSGSCEPCLLGNALTLGVLGVTCEQAEGGDPKTCKGILEISEDIARSSKPPQDILLEVKRTKCLLLSESPEEERACCLHVAQEGQRVSTKSTGEIKLRFVMAGELTI